MLDSRFVEDHESLCPAAYAIGETPAGSGVLCRITGRVVATATDPSSLRSFCWCGVAAARGSGPNGEPVGIGYQECVVWRHNRMRELAERDAALQEMPSRVRDAMTPEFVTRA